jgi:hypothetical protein
VFVVIDVGCLECQIPSKMVGAFESYSEASLFVSVATDAMERHGDTQVAFYVFEVPPVGEIQGEYGEIQGS